jgi:hypothetical protein
MFFNKFLKTPTAKPSSRKRTPNPAIAATTSRNLGKAPAKKGAAQVKKGATPAKAINESPIPGDAQTKPAKPRPIDVDARPIPR